MLAALAQETRLDLMRLLIGESPNVLPASAIASRNDCSGELLACAERADAGDVSWHSTVHDLVSLVVFLALIAASLVLAGSFRGAEHWRDLRSYSLVTGLLGFVLLVIFVIGAAGSWNGVLQRVFVSVLFLWIALLGLRLTQLARDQLGQADPARA